MIRQVESTHAWMESLTYQSTKIPIHLLPLRLVEYIIYLIFDELCVNTCPDIQGGPIALCKAQATQTFEYCAREAAQIFGGLSYTRGGQGEKIERLYREVRGKSLNYIYLLYYANSSQSISIRYSRRF